MRSCLLVLILAQWGLSPGAKKEEAESLLHCNDCLSLPTQLQSFPVNIKLDSNLDNIKLDNIK